MLVVSAGLVLPGAWAPFQMTTIEEGREQFKCGSHSLTCQLGRAGRIGWINWEEGWYWDSQSSHNFGIQD